MNSVVVSPPTSARSHRLPVGDGLHVQVEEIGSPDGPPILFCHGFGQTRRAWSGSAASLATDGYRCVTVDARGHGDSGWLTTGPYHFDQFANDMAILARHFGPETVLVGASMGGLIGLIAEAECGPLFRAMVLVDVTPRWETRGVERILDFMRAHPEGFGSLDEAASSIARYLPHRAGGKSPDRLRSLLVQRDDGRLRWHWDPALLETVSGDIESHQPRLISATKAVRVPLLLVSGGSSDVVSDDTIAEFMQLAPHARHVKVPKATHMVAGDDNHTFTHQVGAFLASLDHPS